MCKTDTPKEETPVIQSAEEADARTGLDYWKFMASWNAANKRQNEQGRAAASRAKNPPQ